MRKHLLIVVAFVAGIATLAAGRRPERRTVTHRTRLIGRLLAIAFLTALAAPALARADTVTQWNLNATNALLVAAGQPPQVSVPHLAMVHGAVYDAVNAIDGEHEGYLLTSRLAQPTRRRRRPRPLRTACCCTSFPRSRSCSTLSMRLHWRR